MDNGQYWPNAIRVSSRLERLLARIFGIKRIGIDLDRNGNLLTLHMRYWRGKYYVISERREAK